VASISRDLAAVPTAVGLATRLAGLRLERENIDASSLLRRAGLSGVALTQGERISVKSQIEFLEFAAEAVEDEYLGLSLASEFDLREMGMYYYVAASSRVLGDAMRRLQRYARAGNEALVVNIETDDCCRIRLAYSGVPRHLDRHQMEFFALSFVRLCRQLTGANILASQASFVHHRSGELRRIRDLLGCEVRFDAPADELSFDRGLADRPLAAHDPFLNRLMVEACEDAIAARTTSRGEFRIIVENTAAPLLPHAEASMRKVAAALGLGERTFARRLAAEGLNFWSILDEMRHDLALRYLREPGLQISQIAWLLGFQQPSAFSHACRRWTGESPSELRRKAAA
jgi:AraC-like DNA-binding protein